MLTAAWKILRDAVVAFIDDEALSRGAGIAFYTVTSIAPLLLIVVAIAGLVFGQEAAQDAITSQLRDLMGQQTSELLQTAIANAAGKTSGILATIIGVATLLVTAFVLLMKKRIRDKCYPQGAHRIAPAKRESFLYVLIERQRLVI